MAIMDTLYANAATERDHEAATRGLVHGMLDAIAAAAAVDMNEVRKVIAQLREHAPRLAAGVVADGPEPMPQPEPMPLMPDDGMSDEDHARRDELLAKGELSDDERTELDAIDAKAGPVPA